MRPSPFAFSLALSLILLSLAASASAQSGASLMLKPWKANQAIELEGSAILQGSGRTRDSVETGIQIFRYESAGRLRFDKTDEHSPAVGYDYLHLDLDTDHPGLPERLVDQSVGVGFGLAKWDDWELGAVLGVGYAGDAPFSDSDAVYAHADLIASRKIDESSSLTFVLNYHGNRTFLPDVPLPGVSYNHRISETLRYSVGVPFSSITWKPLEQLTIDLNYLVPWTIDITATYHITGDIALFAGFHNRFNAFQMDDKRDGDRIFFQQRLVEGGVTWAPCAMMSFTAAGGMAFGQEFSFGWDTRDTRDEIEVSSEPYLRLALTLGF